MAHEIETERENKAKLHRDDLISRMRWLFRCDEVPFECVIGKDNDVIVLLEENVVARIFFRELCDDVVANLAYTLYQCYSVLRQTFKEEGQDNG